MPKKILVVDDEFNIRKLIGTRLIANGYEVIFAADGLETLEKAESEKPDLILLDIMMPKMDGVEVGLRLKAEDKTKYIPIIILTGKWERETVVETMTKVGAKDYIVKPFHPEVLIETIKKILDK